MLQEQYQVLQQKVREIHIKIDLLNNNNVKIASLEGYTTEGNISIDVNSAVRRTCNITMVIANSSFLIGEDKKIWINRRIRIWIGISNILTNKVVWFDKGIYIINKPVIKLNVTTKTISFQGLDLMCLYDGTLGGVLGSSLIIPAGYDLYTAIKNVITLAGVTDYMIENINQVVPYEIEKKANDTTYDILKELCGLYEGYEIFFDENGKFIYQRIKNKTNDPIVWDFSQDKRKLVLEYSIEPDWEYIKNKIIVIGDTVNGIQITAIAENHNSNSPYSIEKIGIKALVLIDENYKTQANAQAYADYELNLRSNTGDKISIGCVPIYSVDGNKLVYFNNEDIGLEGKFCISSVIFNLKSGDPMSIIGYKIY